MKSSYIEFNNKLIIRIVENQKINKFDYFVTREFSSLGENRLEEMYNSTKRLSRLLRLKIQIHYNYSFNFLQYFLDILLCSVYISTNLLSQ